MDDLEATNLNFEMPKYCLPPDLADKIVKKFRSIRNKKNIKNEDLTAFLNGSKDQKVVVAVKGAISHVLMSEKLSPYDESECLNKSNEDNLILQIVSYY